SHSYRASLKKSSPSVIHSTAHRPSRLCSRLQATWDLRSPSSMPQYILKRLSRGNILQTLADLDAGAEHSFGPPTGYELIREGGRYAPKAVIGLACRDRLGRILAPGEFSGVP